LRTSWLSREIIVFGLFAMLALIYAGSFWLPDLRPFIDGPFWRASSSAPLQSAFGIGVAVTGLLGVFSSMMIYRDTRRIFWRMPITALKFSGTMLVLGPASVLFSIVVLSVFEPDLAADRTFRPVVDLLSGFVAIVMTVKLLWELTVFAHLRDREWTSMRRSALLMAGALRSVTIVRIVCGALGSVILPVLVAFGCLPPIVAAGILPLSLAGELLERYLFFTAVIPLKMPGGIAS